MLKALTSLFALFNKVFTTANNAVVQVAMTQHESMKKQRDKSKLTREDIKKNNELSDLIFGSDED